MVQNLRKSVRFNDFGRAECDELCSVAGVLDDISLTGCKIHYDAPVSLSLENDYEVHIRLSRVSAEPLVLMCHPQWQKLDEDGNTEIGFLFLRSPDTGRLESYIQQLHEDQDSTSIEPILPQEDSCQFV